MPDDDLVAITETLSEDGFDYLTTIAAGDRVATVTLGAATDRVVEDTESILFVVDRVECAGCGSDGSFSLGSGSDELEFGILDETTIDLDVSATSPIVEGSVGGAGVGSSTVTVTATASGSAVTLARDVRVKVVTSDGSATLADGDYVALDETVTFGGGTVVGTGAVDDENTLEDEASPAATQSVTLRAVRDSDPEPDETVTVSLADVSPADRAYSWTSAPSETVTISDDDSITITGFDLVAVVDDPNTGVDESVLPMAEDGGARSFAMTLSRAPDSVLRVPVTLSASGGAGLVASCALESSACVQFSAGATTGTLTVTSQADVVITGPQTITATVDSANLPSGVTVASGVGPLSVTRADDEHLVATIEHAAYGVDEGDSVAVKVRVRASADSRRLATAAMLTLASAASSPESAATGDYTAVNETFTVPAGGIGTTDRTFTATVRTTEDTTAEADETFELALTAPADGRVSFAGQTAGATVTIRDDDRATAVSSVAAAPTVVTEGSAVASVITIRLNAAAGTAAVFDWAVTGTGITSGDFALAAGANTTMTTASGGLGGTVTVAAGNSTGTLSLTAVDDSAVEADFETLTFTLTATSGGLSVPADTNVTIAVADNEAPTVSGSASLELLRRGVTLSGSSSFLAEGDLFTARVTLSRSQLTAVTIPLVLPAGNDFTGDSTGATQTTPTVTIPAGQRTADVTVRVQLDNTDESDETLTLGLGTPSYGRMPSSGQVTTSAASAAIKVVDVSAVAATYATTTGGGNQALVAVEIDTGRNLRGRAPNEIRLTYQIGGTNLGNNRTHQWRLIRDGQADLDLTSASAGTNRTVTLAANQIPGPTMRLVLRYTPGTGASGTPTIDVSEVRLREGLATKTLTPTATTATNTAPTADAGADQTVDEGDTVTLTGTAGDTDSDPLTYTWRQTDGTPTVTLTGAATATATFTAPTDLAADAELTFRLSVSDGTNTTTDTVVVTVTAAVVAPSDVVSVAVPADDPGTPVDESAVVEGSSIGVTVTLDRPAPSGGAVVRWYLYQPSGGSAAQPSADVGAFAQAVLDTYDADLDTYGATVAVGQRSVTVTIPAATDVRVENRETLGFAVDSVECGGCGSDGSFLPSDLDAAEVEFAIVDDTVIELGVSAAPVSVREGTPVLKGAGTVAVTVTATAPGDSAVTLDRPVKVRVRSSGGTATSGVDYVAYDETVTFGATTVVGTGIEASPAASVTAGTDLTTRVDSAVESDETVILSLAAVSPADRAYVLGSTPPSTTVTISDDDGDIDITGFVIVDDTNTPTADERTAPIGEDGGTRTLRVTVGRALDERAVIPVALTLGGANAVSSLAPSCATTVTVAGENVARACVSIDAGATIR